MPISKERLFTIVRTAATLEEKLLDISNECGLVAQKGLIGETDPKEACQFIVLQLMPIALLIAKESKIIAIEINWWNLTHKKNERDRIKKDDKRRDADKKIMPRVVDPYRDLSPSQRRMTQLHIRNNEEADDVLRSLGYDDEQIAELDRKRAEQAPDKINEIEEEEEQHEDEDGELFFEQSIPTRFDAQSKEDEQVLQLQKDACSAAFAVAPEGHKPSVSWTTEAKPTVRWFCQCSGFAGEGFATEEDWKEHIASTGL